MDDADRAQELIEAEDERRRRQSAAAQTVIQPTGFCLYCDNKLRPGQRWCDAECLADYTAEQAAQKRNGTPHDD